MPWNKFQVLVISLDTQRACQPLWVKVIQDLLPIRCPEEFMSEPAQASLWSLPQCLIGFRFSPAAGWTWIGVVASIVAWTERAVLMLGWEMKFKCMAARILYGHSYLGTSNHSASTSTALLYTCPGRDNLPWMPHVLPPQAYHSPADADGVG